MSGICSAHQHHDPDCATCTARPERIVLERTSIAQGDFDRRYPTEEIDRIMGHLHDSD